ncbi:DUF2079 domain-containing protein [Williamsia sterculiae]|uniref:Uncharacterized membrane protein n=1 Tax=Williamsia sterculiae TaxID=1344003 RepID=A0A1N7CNA8_9NOCA|nr:DUF2079 domain-containing protein [Williamsia sterculiae]SIR65129.1 Uncharacterized membrane protein [Williamsia sterculiae]
MSTAIRSRISRPSAAWVTGWGAGAAAAVVYVLFVVRRYQRLDTNGWDLGIFTQAVRAYSRFTAPLVPLEGDHVNLLGDHFQPWIALIAPIYRIFPTPVTLIVVQALLFALAVIPVVRLSTSRFGVVAGVAIGVGFAVSWGLVQALSFDFHEIALAVPLVAFSLVALCEERWRAALAYAAPLVFCKEDLGVTVAVIALLVAWRGGRVVWTAAAVTGVWGIAWTVVTMKVIIPSLADSGYGYESKFSGGATDSALRTLRGIAWGDPRSGTLFLLAVVVLVVGVLSPLMLVAVPTLAWRFLSTNTLYWGTGFHYNAILMSVVFVALIDALSGWGATVFGRRRVTAIALGCAGVGLALCYGNAFARLPQPSFYDNPPQFAAAKALAQRIPDGAAVATTNNLAPLVVSRHEVSLFPKLPRTARLPNWLLIDTTTHGYYPTDNAGVNVALDAVQSTGGYHRVAESAGVVLATRN